MILIILPAFVFSACGTGSTSSHINSPLESEDFMMGTVITQKVYGENAAIVVAQVRERLGQVERSMTINAPGGDINKLNAAAGKGWVALDSDAVKVLQKAEYYAELSGGAFDSTIGPLVKAWGVFTEHPRVPAVEDIQKLLDLIGYKKLKTDAAREAARLDNVGCIVDLGGIAKGYAGDEAVEIYRRNGIKSAYINLGGNVMALGNKPDGTQWRIGIQDPRGASGSYVGVLQVADKAVVSSGDYERFFEKDGRRYHHIIDPKTGYPADSGLISTTIVASAGIDADALSTATFVLGLDKGLKLINSLKGIEAVFITDEKEIFITEGLKNHFDFNSESKGYKYAEKR